MKKLISLIAAVAILATCLAVMPMTSLAAGKGDVNNDGNVNNRDLALLQQYLNGWDVTLG